jgi:phosphoribosylaminoimidazolecarboxamide formyltransferase/IMP cyclohydrolase
MPISTEATTSRDRLARELAAKAFAHTAAYDAAISGYLSRATRRGRATAFPKYLTLPFERAYGCATARTRTRRGRSTSSATPPGSLARAESLGAGGKELSFNNLVDVEAALDACASSIGPRRSW